MKPKEWLLANGHINEITRGRMSRENILLIEKAVSSGVIIEGYSVTKPVIVSGTDKPTAQVTRDNPNSARVFDMPDEARSEDLWNAFTASGPVGMRTVCNICKSSLTYCHCTSPRVWIDYQTEGVVYFKSIKAKG